MSNICRYRDNDRSMSSKAGRKRGKLVSETKGKPQQPRDLGILHRLYEVYRPSVAFVEVEDLSTGRLGIGSSFHIGEGIFVTAAHVVRGKRVLTLGTTHSYAVRDPSPIKRKPYRACPALKISEPRVLLPADSDNEARAPDVALVVADLPNEGPPALKLGGHLDDWMMNDEMVLHRSLLMGYPPVPLTNSVQIIAITCEVNARVTDLRTSPHVHFIVSSMARGGFSGGPVMHEAGFVLGLVTESLVRDAKPEELGFMTVLTVEPIFNLLLEHNMFPAVQKEGWDGYWDKPKGSPGVVINRGDGRVEYRSLPSDWQPPAGIPRRVAKKDR
jgi:Trypsin-like peptidase domain